MTGYSGADYNYDFFLLKYNATGFNIWEKEWYYTHRAEGEGIALDSYLDIYITGWITSPWDLLLLKYIQYPPGEFELTTDPKSPDFDGKLILYWNESIRADSYSVYMQNNYISVINTMKLSQFY